MKGTRLAGGKSYIDLHKAKRSRVTISKDTLGLLRVSSHGATSHE